MCLLGQDIPSSALPVMEVLGTAWAGASSLCGSGSLLQELACESQSSLCGVFFQKLLEYFISGIKFC